MCTNLDGSQKEGGNFFNLLQKEGVPGKGGFPPKKGGGGYTHYIHCNNHRFSAFYMEKNCLGASHPCLHQGITLDRGGLQLPPEPQLQSFLVLPKTNAPIFFLYYPLILFIIFKVYLCS